MTMGRRLFAGLLVSALSAFGVVAANAGSAAAADCGYLFDDFHYTSATDPALTANGWTPRSYQGGPGVPGATWSPSAITFPAGDGQQVMQLTASTDGTAAGTRHAELYSTRKRYLEGTYASRVRFTDTPVSGADGDHINQTFFTISPLNGDMDPTYSELDISEYLPNGGWGETGPINYQTTWYTYRADPWYADNLHSEQRSSLDGWHDLVAQVADGRVVYWIDGVRVGDHGGKYFPRQTMTINWNLWFIDTAAHTGGLSTYIEQVDWVLFAKNQVLSPAQVSAQTAAYRTAGTRFADTVASSGPCVDPSPSSPTPSVSVPTPPPAGDCSSAPAWQHGTVYTGGSTVKHEKSRHGDPSGPKSGEGVHLWRARYWTQGSEPGWTEQWQDLGRC
ncbi:glycosyl hydrolase [Actinoplanes utahensis]|uniref:Glycosyl hydrolase n=1 Tax=Actinoplanes utahensis TaxID=1869 RepID=A0A0A6UMH3_ACTUT|nr:glycosyl hydrolase [Actinoplanes utahensis]KHD75519.1 glycosyl hydrolase [Actinoplanes utahensis]GIF32310.1 glycosyl hydrolase [Actinoplanes utahensis]